VFRRRSLEQGLRVFARRVTKARVEGEAQTHEGSVPGEASTVG